MSGSWRDNHALCRVVRLVESFERPLGSAFSPAVRSTRYFPCHWARASSRVSDLVAFPVLEPKIARSARSAPWHAAGFSPGSVNGSAPPRLSLDSLHPLVIDYTICESHTRAGRTGF